jgi:hypothetical protein
MTDYDSPWKEALDVYFEPFMAFFFPEAYGDIDWRRDYEPLDKELQQIVREGELGRRLVDKLVKVWLKSGQEQWILVHVEVQTAEEADFAKRMYVYNYRLFDRYNREVVSLAVLGDENPMWRPEKFGYSRWGFQTGIQFPTVKLLDYDARLEALEYELNPFATVVLAHLKTLQTRRDETERHAWKIRLIKGLYERGLSATDVRYLFRFIDWMMDLPAGLEDKLWTEVMQLEKEKQMPYIGTPERVERRWGLVEGLTRGIEVALKLRFHEDGLRLMPEIREIHDQQKLEAILDSVETAASPDDLRRIWAN